MARADRAARTAGPGHDASDGVLQAEHVAVLVIGEGLAVAREGDDRPERLLRVGRMYEKATDWHTRRAKVG